MPLLVCGAEGEWALFQNTLSVTGADTKRRGSVQVTQGEQMFKAFTGTRDMWFHIRLAGNAINSNGANVLAFFLVRDTNNDEMITFLPEDIEFAASWFNRFQTADSSGGALSTTTENFPAASLEFHEYDVHIEISTATNPDDTCVFTFYRDGQLRFTRTVADAGGWALPANILCGPKDTNILYDDVFYQDIIVSDAVPTVGMELAVLVPSAVGNYSDFANDYTNIDDFGYDSSTVISTSTPADKESWIFATPAFTLGDKVIYGLALDTVAQTDLAAAISDFRPFFRIVAVDYNQAALGANNIAPDSYLTIAVQNPATTQPWTEADLTGLEAGIEAL